VLLVGGVCCTFCITTPEWIVAINKIDQFDANEPLYTALELLIQSISNCTQLQSY